ncbi:MAG TPA: tripartite tricarboxylate transporter substrate binding protein [Burkholderiales bacterium]|nr:tripartite tricarboxylate transporter substrate binding protein [Burkholderiales bacterium]
MKRTILMRIVLAVAIVAGARPAFAQKDYPARPIRVLIPFPAAGAADTIGRTIAEPLSAQLRQTIVIDNRPGAAGRLATDLLAKAEPDGYTLLVGGVGPLAISPFLYKKLPYDAERDFLPITRAAEIINVMVLNPASGVRDVRQFIEWAKKRTDETRYGSSGPGQLDHLAGVQFQRLAGVRMTHVPYKGGGPALIDLVSGDLQVMLSTYVVAVPHINSGKLRAIAVTTARRQPLLPDLPPIAETLPGFDISNWNGIFAPAKTPARIADRLFAEINKAMLAPAVKKRQNYAGIEPEGSPSREAFAKFMREERARWGKFIREAGIRLE